MQFERGFYAINYQGYLLILLVKLFAEFLKKSYELDSTDTFK